MIRKFLNLAKNHASESNDYLSAFKAMYSDQPYYTHVKESILDQVDMIGMDVEVAEQLLSWSIMSKSIFAYDSSDDEDGITKSSNTLDKDGLYLYRLGSAILNHKNVVDKYKQ